jgi:hypothetical protein
MTENNAAQPGLTDDQIDALRVRNDAVKDPLAEWERGSKRYRRAFARLVESALLSKLRAEGVQAGDERAACPTDVCQAGKSDGVLCANDECDRANGVRPAGSYTPTHDQPHQTGVGEWCAPGPAADQRRAWLLRFADVDRGDCVYYDEQEARGAFARSEARGWNCYLFEYARRAALASAPVAGEAQPVAWMMTKRRFHSEPSFTQMDPSGVYESQYAPLYAAPQASEAVRWVVTDDMRAAVRFAPSSAHWSERLKEFFGPDAREGINALEKQLREARADLDRQKHASEAVRNQALEEAARIADMYRDNVHEHIRALKTQADKDGECKPCNGMGFIDGVGDRCQACNGDGGDCAKGAGKWPMLSELHLHALMFAYNEGYSKAYDGRVFPNPFSENGSQAAAWQLGTDDGTEARAAQHPRTDGGGRE